MRLAVGTGGDVARKALGMLPFTRRPTFWWSQIGKGKDPPPDLAGVVPSPTVCPQPPSPAVLSPSPPSSTAPISTPIPTPDASSNPPSTPTPPSIPSARPRRSYDNIFQSRKKWIVEAQKILRFYAYYETPLINNLYGGASVRRCTILYFLASDEISVVEELENNSGFLAGTIVGKAKMWMSNGELLGPDQFRVGGSVLLNGLLLHIYDCDAFTRGHMPDQPTPTPVPTGEYTTPRFEGTSSNPRNSGPRAMPPLNLDHVRPRLLFYVKWDDGRELGLVHHYRLTFHTCDDTIEIKQVAQLGDSSDMPVIVAKRQKFLRPQSKGLASARVDLIGAHSFLPPSSYINLNDFQFGKTLRIANQDLLICGACDTTLAYLREHIGPQAVSEADPNNGPWYPPRSSPLRVVHSSRRRGLLERFKQLSLHSGTVLRFQGRRLHTPVGQEGLYPRYSIAYYMCDEELSVHMTAPRNSGMLSGELLRRQRVTNPDTHSHYTHGDLTLGALLKLPQVCIEITAMDDEARRALDKDKVPIQDNIHGPIHHPPAPCDPPVTASSFPHPPFAPKEACERGAEACVSPGAGLLGQQVGWVWECSALRPSDDQLDEYITHITASQLSGLEEREFARVLRLVREASDDRRGGARQLREALHRHTTPPGSGTKVNAEVLREHLMLRDREWRVLGLKFFLGVCPPPPTLVDFDVFLRLLDRYLLHVNTGRNLIVSPQAEPPPHTSS